MSPMTRRRESGCGRLAGQRWRRRWVLAPRPSRAHLLPVLIRSSARAGLERAGTRHSGCRIRGRRPDGPAAWPCVPEDAQDESAAGGRRHQGAGPVGADDHHGADVGRLAGPAAARNRCARSGVRFYETGYWRFTASADVRAQVAAAGVALEGLAALARTAASRWASRSRDVHRRRVVGCARDGCASMRSGPAAASTRATP